MLLSTEAALTSASRTWAGVAVGFLARYRAAAPVTCGVAIEVPLIDWVPVLLLFALEVMPTPGAQMSRHEP